MSDDTSERLYVTVALRPELVEELHKVVNAGDFVDFDVLVETWLIDKLSEWLVARSQGRANAETVEELVAEKERLLAWMTNYVATVQRSEQEMRHALEQIERLKTLIPRRRAGDHA